MLEIMVAVAIMIIITGAGLASFTFSQRKSRDARRKADLSQIARLALKNKVITESAKIKNKEITSKLGNKYLLETTNELLGSVTEIEGLKTGWTPEAGGCFIGLIGIGDKLVLSVVLNSQDRFADTKMVVDWLKKSVGWQDYLAEI